MLALVACSPEVEESMTSTAADDSATTSGPTSATAAVTESSVSVSDDDGNSVTAGSDDADPTEDSAASESDPSSGEGELESEGPGDSGSGDDTDGGNGEGNDNGTQEESTGEPAVDCEPLDEDGCEGAGGDCMALVGRPFVHENGMNYCAGDEEFTACAAMAGCDDAPTVACDGDDEPWLFPNGCLPGGWDTCDPPGNGEFDLCK